MKKFVITSILVALFATAGSTIMAQDKQEDYLGLPGDNLNLYAVMKLFQQSKTLEDFERSLNDPNSTINNLDLNGDNLVDYIKVIDNVDGDVHNIVLQVAVSPKENQDVAVFTVQRFQNGQVQIQLTGDEDLYGKDYIIEPIIDEANSGGTPNPGYTGNTRTVNGQTVTYVTTSPVQIATWPLVRFIFLPTYTVWHSNWYWGYYPSYWHPWHTYSWNYYYGYQYNWYNDYYGHYRRWNYHRYSRWNDDYYIGHRTYSPDVRHQIQAGYYKTTYSHPEQRRDGEVLFAKSHPDEYRRITSASSANTSSRRTTSTVTSGNHPSVNGSGSNRRSTNSTMTNRPVSNPSNSNNNSVTTRRTTSTVTSRTVSNPSNGNNSVNNRKSTTPAVNRPVNNSSPDKNKVTTRQTTSTVTSRPAGNASSGQKAGTNRSPKQPGNNKINSSSARRNVNKSESTVKRDTKTKDSDNKDSNHRRQ